MRKFTHSLFVVLVVIGLLIIGCDKADEMDQSPPFGAFTAEATLNDTSQWEANSVFGYVTPEGDTLSTIFLEYYISNNCPIEIIRFKNIPLTLDTISLQHIKRGTSKDSNQATAYHSAVDCDATGEVYNLLDAESINNYLKINAIEQEESGGSITEIQGLFQMTMVRDTARPKIIFPDRPDTLRLKDGTFNAKILQSE